MDSQPLTQFLDKLLVLIQLLEGFHVHAGQAGILGLLTVGSISQNAHLHLRSGNVAKPGKMENEGGTCNCTETWSPLTTAMSEPTVCLN